MQPPAAQAGRAPEFEPLALHAPASSTSGLPRAARVLKRGDAVVGLIGLGFADVAAAGRRHLLRRVRGHLSWVQGNLRLDLRRVGALPPASARGGEDCPLRRSRVEALLSQAGVVTAREELVLEERCPGP